RKAIVNGERIGVVLDQHAFAEFCDIRQEFFQLGVERLSELADHVAVDRWTKLGAMSSDRGQFQRREDAIDVGERSSADERKGAIELNPKALQDAPQLAGDSHFLRPRGDI